MLEYHANQASGLLGLAQQGPRMLAVVNHGDEQAELPLLWQLCLALVGFGHSVAVLDATTQESDSNPGLAELLDNGRWQDRVSRETPAWVVLPAGKGIQSLCTSQAPRLQALQQLHQLFPHDGIVILYCNVECMTALIAGTGVEPLLAVSRARTSLITSYLALKRLLITAKLNPTIINLIQDGARASSNLEQSALTSLRECAKRFLGQNVLAFDIVEQLNDECQNEDIQHLALRLMENALPLLNMNTVPIVSPHMPHFGQIDHFAGSH
jgi:hypothetical protein